MKEEYISGNNHKKNLLAVMAHPDDETFGIGGTLALYASQGVNVHLICATRGEAGEVDQDLIHDNQTVAEYRESELRCAARNLGIGNIHFLNYRDSGMPGTSDNHHPEALMSAPVDEVAAKIVQLIDIIKPQVVITFDPIGGYHHPDHIAIHKATVRAFELTVNGSNSQKEKSHIPDKLYFQTIQRGFLRLLVRLMILLNRDPRHFGNNGDIDLLSISEVDFPIHARINVSPVGKIKDQASECYISQGGKQMSIGALAHLRRLFFNTESYIRFYPPPQKDRIESDLFDGIDIQHNFS